MQMTRSNGDNLGLALRTAVELSSERLRHERQRRLERGLGRIPLYRLTRPQNPDKIGTHPCLLPMRLCKKLIRLAK